MSFTAEMVVNQNTLLLYLFVLQFINIFLYIYLGYKNPMYKYLQVIRKICVEDNQSYLFYFMLHSCSLLLI